MTGQHLGVQPRPADIFVAVMGMTGAGKSTFISLCTGEDVTVGHDLQACTQQVGVYKRKWSSDCDIYLLDTPGFDDTRRSDTEVLKEIAAWLTKSYELKLELSGILYLHRITDPRMQGSAKKNLFMLKKLCGADGLKNVLLVSTMWEIVDEDTGYSREHELIKTEDFWGVLIRSGARVRRHDNGRESAMRLLKELVLNKKMAMSIQKEMVTDGKTLDQTQAGIELESEMQKQREKFKQELAEVKDMMREAIEARDRESSEALRQHKADTQRKLDKIMREREDLKVTMEAMHADKFAMLEKKHQEQKEEIERRQEYETKVRRELEQELKAQMQDLTQRLGENGRYCILGVEADAYSTPRGLNPSDKTMYVALGMNDSWYHHYHADGRCRTEISDNLKVEYPALFFWLSEMGMSECPVQVSLGWNKQHYVRLHNGEWNFGLPFLIQSRVDNSVNRIWFGCEDDHVIEHMSGELVWKFKKRWLPWWFRPKWATMGLESTLDDCKAPRGSELLELALDIGAPGSYIAVTKRGIFGEGTGWAAVKDLARHRRSRSNLID